MTARKTPTKAAPAKKVPAKVVPPKPAADKPATVDLTSRVEAALSLGFSRRFLTNEAVPGTTCLWRTDRLDPENAAKLAALLDKIEAGKIAPPERQVAEARTAGPSKAALLALINDVRAAKSITAVHELIETVVPPAS